MKTAQGIISTRIQRWKKNLDGGSGIATVLNHSVLQVIHVQTDRDCLPETVFPLHFHPLRTTNSISVQGINRPLSLSLTKKKASGHYLCRKVQDHLESVRDGTVLDRSPLLIIVHRAKQLGLQLASLCRGSMRQQHEGSTNWHASTNQGTRNDLQETKSSHQNASYLQDP